MKLLTSATLLVLMAGLAACATPSPDPAAGATLAANEAIYEDKGELLTGSRIPQKSTVHVLKRVGSKEYKKASLENGQHNPWDDK